MKKTALTLAVRSIKRRNSAERKLINNRFYYEYKFNESGEYVSDGLQALHKSDKRFYIYIPATIASADNSPISDFGQMYMLTLAYRFTARALLTNYQKSGLVMLDTLYKQVKAQGSMLFGQAMFAEIETECKYSYRYFDSKLHKFFQRQTPKMNQRIIHDDAKEFAYNASYDKSKTVDEYDVFQDVEDLLSAALERMTILVRAGQIKNYCDFSLHSSAIYAAINREITYTRTITAQMSDNVRIFDENGLERIVSAIYFDEHEKLSVDAILQELAGVMKTLFPRLNVEKAILAYRKTLDGFTMREIGNELAVDHKQIVRWSKSVEYALESVEFAEKVSEMV